MLLASLASASGCATSDDIFAGSRIENLCNDAIPVCATRAGCVLSEDEYIRGAFPGGQTFIVRTPTEDSRFVVRILLNEQVFPGTELLVRAAHTGCDGFDAELRENVDLFEAAGESQVLTTDLEVRGRGDHLVEVFSDMASGFLMVVEVQQR